MAAPTRDAVTSGVVEAKLQKLTLMTKAAESYLAGVRLDPAAFAKALLPSSAPSRAGQPTPDAAAMTLAAFVRRSCIERNKELARTVIVSHLLRNTYRMEVNPKGLEELCREGYLSTWVGAIEVCEEAATLKHAAVTILAYIMRRSMEGRFKRLASTTSEERRSMEGRFKRLASTTSEERRSMESKVKLNLEAERRVVRRRRQVFRLWVGIFHRRRIQARWKKTAWKIRLLRTAVQLRKRHAWMRSVWLTMRNALVMTVEEALDASGKVSKRSKRSKRAKKKQEDKEAAAKKKAEAAAQEQEAEHLVECIICLEEATCRARGCGHLILCGVCVCKWKSHCKGSMVCLTCQMPIEDFE